MGGDERLQQAVRQIRKAFPVGEAGEQAEPLVPSDK
jgi:hypothetical protein